MSRKINWGIIGLGKIAHKFAEDLLLHVDANLYAVASRSLAKAESFSKQFHSETFYGSYRTLTEDPKIDVVYIATPHVFHYENTMMCLEAGKAVLCEKAFGMNSKEVEKMIAKAEEKKVFLMEALWTRFIPATEKVLELLNSGLIGDLKSLRADFGFKADFDPEKRLFNKKLGGGSLLDIGIYPIFLSLLTLGIPKKMKASAVMSFTGVDKSVMMLFDYESNQTAILDSSLVVSTPGEAWFHGDKGSLKLYPKFHQAKQISFYKDQELKEIYRINYKGNGYFHEIKEVIDCLKVGKTESEKMPHIFSLNLMHILDRVRVEIGLSYWEESE